MFDIAQRLSTRGLAVFLLACGLLSLTGTRAVSAAPSNPLALQGRSDDEVTSARTPWSRTYAFDDGRKVRTLSASREQWKDSDGRWHSYEHTLTTAASGFSGDLGHSSAQLPLSLRDSQPVVVDMPDVRVSIALDEADGDGRIDQGAVAYDNVKPGIDATYHAVPEGLKEDLTVSSADALEGLSWTLEATATADVRLREDGSGGLLVRVGDHDTARIPRPELYERANHDEQSHGRWRATAIGPNRWKLVAELDDTWLGAVTRRWPVVLDPTVADTIYPDRGALVECTTDESDVYDQPHCYTQSSFPMDGNLAGFFMAGEDDWWTWEERTVLWRFPSDLTQSLSEEISSATLKFARPRATFPPGTSDPLVARRLTADPGSAPTRLSLPRDAFNSSTTVAQTAAGSAGPARMDLTSVAQQWQLYRQTNGASGWPNYGLLFTHDRSCTQANTCAEDQLASVANPDPTMRPVLQITSWSKAPVGSAVTSPKEGELSGRRFVLEAKAARTSVASAAFQYVAGNDRTWRDVPQAALRTMTGAAVSSAAQPMSGSTGNRRTTPVVWDLGATSGGDVDGPVHIRAVLQSSVFSDGGVTPAVNARLDRRGVDGGASTDVGPGSVDLMSGELSVDEQDASVDAFLNDLAINRTYKSRGVSTRNADMFGPGWEANIEADGGAMPYRGIYNYTEVDNETVSHQSLDPSKWNWEAFFETFDEDGNFDPDALGADIETSQETRQWQYHYAVVENADGTKLTFKQTVDPDGNVTGWAPDDDHPGLKLASSTGSSGEGYLTLTDTAGNVTRFQSEAGSPNYRPLTYTEAGSAQKTTFSYSSTATGRWRLDAVTAPNPGNGGHDRKLLVDWGTPPNNPSTTQRVLSVRFSDGFSAPFMMAAYGYDANGRLTSESDPRAGGLSTAYAYDASTGLLSSMTSPGEQPWRFGYTQVTGDAGRRLETVTRQHPNGQDAVTTVRYGVPISGSGAPYDLSAAQTARWSQDDDLPWDAVAVFPPGATATGTSPQYDKAKVFYMGLQGKVVDTVTGDGAVTTSEHDAAGNVIFALTAANRKRALAAGSTSAQVADSLATRYGYAADNVSVISQLDPQREIRLDSGSTVTGRVYTTTDYDEGAPSGGPYYLPTTQRRSVRVGSTVYDLKTLRTWSYANPDGSPVGWRYRKAIKTVEDPSGLALTRWSIMNPTFPLVEESRTPEGAAGGASANVRYYDYANVSATHPVPAHGPGCATGDWNVAAMPAGSLCSMVVADNATTGRGEKYQYSPYGALTNVDEYAAGASTPKRTIATPVDDIGRPKSSTVTIAGGATSTTSYGYSSTTGRQTSVNGGSRGTIQRVYDNNGRLSSYTDANASTTTYTYDLAGRLSRVSDARGTRDVTYTQRGLASTITDSRLPSAIALEYDPDGNVTKQTLPNGLRGDYDFDPDDSPKSVTWTKTTGCSTTCTWVLNTVTRDASQRIATQHSALSDQTYSYDGGGRLKDVTDTRSNVCTARSYTYDKDSNRKQKTTKVSAAAGACGTGTATTVTLTPNDADRLTDTGYAYDSLGRMTSTPATASGLGSAATIGYDADDNTTSITAGSSTQQITRDPLGRIKQDTSQATGLSSSTTTALYADDDDAPAAQVVGTSWTRLVPGADDATVASVNSAGTITYQLANLHGDVVVTATSTATSPTSQTEYDEFGNQAWSNPTPTNKGLRMAWLGAPNRLSSFLPGGPVQMGERLYLPSIGRFTSIDPVAGGSCTDYDYTCQDPVNSLDLDGRMLDAPVFRGRLDPCYFKHNCAKPLGVGGVLIDLSALIPVGGGARIGLRLLPAAGKVSAAAARAVRTAAKAVGVRYHGRLEQQAMKQQTRGSDGAAGTAIKLIKAELRRRGMLP